MWSDNETTQDLIGFQVHADLIRSIVTNDKLLPLTIGIFGDWGGGKTSIMKMLEKDLDPDSYQEPEEKSKYERVACLYFNGWLFEGYDDAKSAILSSILLQIGEHKRLGPKVRDKITSLMKSVNWMRLARFGLKEVALPAIAAYLTGGASLIPTFAGSAKSFFSDTKIEESNDKNGKTGADAIVEKASAFDWEDLIKKDKSPSSPLDVRTFRMRFAELIEDCDIDSLVVLIDDLDRCSPERILDNLEAIKLFLNVDRTAFIIGADPRIVRHAIAVRYSPHELPSLENKEEEEEEKGRLVNDYLEKLIQVPYQLPRLSPSEIETYMVLLFCQQDPSEDVFKKCHDAYKETLTKDRYSTFGYAAVKEALGDKEIPHSLAKNLTMCASVASLITEGLKGNPRQVKRFLNAFLIRKELAKISNLTIIRDDVLVKLMVLEYGHPHEFRQLFEWQSAQQGFPIQIRNIEDFLLDSEGKKESVEIDTVGKNWLTDFFRKWVVMEPKLSEIDLRDYFWIARDRLHSSLSGLSLVPLVVRRLFDDLISDNPPRRNNALEAVKSLVEDESIKLLDLLAQHIYRNPDLTNGFDVLSELALNEYLGALDTLVEVLSKCPPDSINPAVGVNLVTLTKSKPELKERLDPELHSLGSTQTKIGAAIKKHLEKLEG